MTISGYQSYSYSTFKLQITVASASAVQNAAPPTTTAAAAAIAA